MMYRYLTYSILIGCFSLSSIANAKTEEGLNGHGYIMFGGGISNDPVLNKQAYDWAGTGGNIFKLPGLNHADTSGGRLGNDGNWVQLHGDYGVNKNDMNWGAHVMFSTNGYSDNFVPEWIYVDAVGVISSNPEAAIWAGEKYVSRVSTPLVVNEALASDGVGAGLEDVDVGFGQFDFSVTRNLYNSYESPSSDGEMHQGDMILFSSSVSNIDVGDEVKADFFLNYTTYMGPNRDEEKEDTGQTYSDFAPDGYQVALRLNQGDFDNGHQFFIRYSNNARQGVTREWWQPVPGSLFGGFFYGHYQLTEDFRLEYTFAHETELYSEEDRENNANNNYRAPVNFRKSNWESFIVRNTYVWNRKTSTQIELGYEQLKFDALNSDEDGTNSGYKVTLSQNLHIGRGAYDRPVINFYVTYADMEVETKVYDSFGIDDSTELGSSSALTFGVMLEAWF